MSPYIVSPRVVPITQDTSMAQCYPQAAVIRQSFAMPDGFPGAGQWGVGRLRFRTAAIVWCSAERSTHAIGASKQQLHLPSSHESCGCRSRKIGPCTTAKEGMVGIARDR